MATWQEIGEHWNRAQQMGWQAVQAALDVGDELTEKKLDTPRGEWVANLQRYVGFGNPATAYARAAELMRLALHRELIEQSKPDSMRQALELLPKVPTKTGEKRIIEMKEES